MTNVYGQVTLSSGVSKDLRVYIANNCQVDVIVPELAREMGLTLHSLKTGTVLTDHIIGYTTGDVCIAKDVRLRLKVEGGSFEEFVLPIVMVPGGGGDSVRQVILGRPFLLNRFGFRGFRMERGFNTLVADKEIGLFDDVRIIDATDDPDPAIPGDVIFGPLIFGWPKDAVLAKCKVCNLEAPGLRLCALCKEAGDGHTGPRYCSKQCQSVDWKAGHRSVHTPA